MKIKLIILILIFKFSEQQCTNGCLICSEENLCLFCDFLSYYYYDNHQKICIQSIDQNCLEPGPNRNCIKCKPGFYYEILSFKCLEPLLYIPNCYIYQSPNQCSLCEEGYYLTEGCSKLYKIIDNCKIQENNEICYDCKQGYVLSSDKKNCFPEKDDNCLFETNAVCQQCKTGKFYNPEIPLKDILNFSKPDLKFTEFLEKVLNKRFFQVKDYCEDIMIDYCYKLKSATECQECEPGFYLTEQNLCVYNPKQIIKNCEEYQTNEICKKCKALFYKETDQKCSPISPIENCSEYQDLTCIKCDVKYYYENKLCKERIKSANILNCKEYETEKDECKNCQNDFLYNINITKCLPKIENCQTHLIDGDNLKCTVCNSEFFFDENNICQKGNIEKCEIYENQTTCSKCKNMFYLNENECLPHKNIDQCDIYLSSEKHQCQQCQNDNVLMNLNANCEKVVNLPNCQIYQTELLCAECNDGFYKNNDSCEQITQFKCLQQNAVGECIKCKNEYFLDERKKCVLVYEFQKEYCLKQQETTTGNIEKFQCEQCLTNSYFFELPNIPICVNMERIENKTEKCIEYSYNGTNYICLRCEKGYYFNTADNQCILECSNQIFPIKLEIEQKDGEIYKIKNIKKNLCVPQNGNCQIKVYNAKGEESCQKCIQNTMNLTLESIFEYSLHINDQLIENLGKTIKTINCQSKTTELIFPSNNDHQLNCFSYLFNTNFYCNACNFKKTSQIFTQNTINYLSCEKNIVGCRDQQYYGFYLDRSSYLAHNLFTERWLSCHICYESNKIPFLHLQLDANEKVTATSLQKFGYNLSYTIPINSAFKDSELISCYEPTAEGLLISEENYTSVFPQNCAFGLINIGIEKNFKNSQNERNSVFCIECKPGYKKITNVQFQTTSCQKITNCSVTQSQTWVNTCEKCNDNYTWGYEPSSKKVYYNQCILSRVDNCLIINQNDSKLCHICKKGFYLSNDQKLCEKISIGKCENYMHSYHTYLKNVGLNSNHIFSEYFLKLFLTQYSQGCIKCQQNYVGLIDNYFSPQQCVNSYLLEQKVDTLDFDFIPGCQIHSGNNKSCFKCYQNYIINQTKTRCFYNINLPFCKIAQSSTQCFECEEKSYLVNNVCKQGLIDYCLIYYSGEPQKCKQCVTQMRPTVDKYKCVYGNQQLCDIYEDKEQTSCKKCINDNDFLMQLQNGSYYCIQNTIVRYQCNDLNQFHFDSNNFYCNTCTNYHYVNSERNNLVRSICVPFQKIEYCIEHDVKNSYKNSTFKCLKCNTGYFVSEFGFKCEKRSVNIQHCQEMLFNGQYCEKCSNGYFLSSEKKKCIENPKGTNDCLKYDSELKCLECYENYYLFQALCLQVNEPITNCVYYDRDQQCTQCNTNYFLKEKECLLPKAQNCNKIKNENECESCYEDYFLQKQEDLLHCVFKKIFNCILLDDSTGKCKQCETGFYPNDSGECEVTQNIPNCLINDTIDTCSLCNENTILNFNKKSCEPKEMENIITLENCQKQFFQQNGVCLFCQKFHYLENGKCVACKTPQNCAFCDPKQPDICQMCDKGFYQSSYRGKCELNKVDQIQSIQFNFQEIYIAINILVYLFNQFDVKIILILKNLLVYE